MRWSFSSTTNIITGIIYVVAILVFLFVARILLLYLVNGELSLDKIFKPREITPNELSMRVGQSPIPEEPPVSNISIADSSAAVNTNVVGSDTVIANAVEVKTVSANTISTNTVSSNSVKSNTVSANTASANPVTINAININEVHAYYYIIIGSFRNIVQAKQKVEKSLSEFNTGIIILPPTKEGYYRISYGKYYSHEEAEAAIDNIRKKIKSDAWILTVKE
jgi:hypothetical protein